MTDNAQTPPRYDCIQLHQESGVIVVNFVDERIADPSRIEQLGQELISLSENQDPKVVIDFSRVRFVSSLAINKLLVLEKRIRQRGGQLRLAELEPEVQEVFGIARLNEVFTIHEARQDAVQGLTNPNP